MDDTEDGRRHIAKRASDILIRTYDGLIEGLTGLAASKKEELFLSAGYLLQKIRSKQFLSIFIKEWNHYREKGRIKEDYETTQQCYSCLQELLDFLDNDVPDEARFSVLKNIFLVAATEKVTDRNSHLPVEYMKISRKLSAGEVLLLNTLWRIAKGTTTYSGGSADDLVRFIADESGLVHVELVENHANDLIKKNLVFNHEVSDNTYRELKVKLGFISLTELGESLCSYIEKYNDEVEANRSLV